MKVLVAGATGKTGRRLIGELKSRGHYPIALVRESSDTSTLSSVSVAGTPPVIAFAMWP
ncbi:NAD(P)H-binding protein [Hafnia alvei]|uniref:NAD(P)H-binding protein n=1 Tax=Hafnia TaxID=568 RepID=UPI001CAA86F0|nr:NAD(P)H-binding protein [Hafnia alvei]